jgi:hypothetical protein
MMLGSSDSAAVAPTGKSHRGKSSTTIPVISSSLPLDRKYANTPGKSTTLSSSSTTYRATKSRPLTPPSAALSSAPKASPKANNSKEDILASLIPDYRPSSSSQQRPSSSSTQYDYDYPVMPRPPPSAPERPNMAGLKLFKGRTAVYAGTSKVVTVPQVYPLQDLCLRVLMNHLDQIYQVGDLPYFLLKPVLVKCSADQLRRIEL